MKPYSPIWFLLNYLEGWNDDDLAIAIRKDIRPDLSQYTNLILDQTTEFFLNLFKQYRPDMTQIHTKDGKEWFKKIIKSSMEFK